MKKFITSLFLMLLFPFHSNAFLSKTIFSGSFLSKDLTKKIELEVDKDLTAQFDLFLNDKRIGSCLYKTVWAENKLKAKASLIHLELEKESCHFIGDKNESDFQLIQKAHLRIIPASDVKVKGGMLLAIYKENTLASIEPKGTIKAIVSSVAKFRIK